MPRKGGGRPLADRLWEKVDRSGGPDACWPWTAYINPMGYGAIRTLGRSLGAHRCAYELTVGPIPPGLLVRHRCDNPPCCNPAHLEIGTHADNARDHAERGNPWRRYRRLSAAQVDGIRSAAGSVRTIARRFGVSSSHVNAIRRGLAWARLLPGQDEIRPSTVVLDPDHSP